jgi:hypothetical protein
MNSVSSSYALTIMAQSTIPQFFIDHTSYTDHVLLVLMPNNGEKNECHLFNTRTDRMCIFNCIGLYLFPNLHYPSPYKGVANRIERIARNNADWSKAKMSNQRPYTGPYEDDERSNETNKVCTLHTFYYSCF